MRMRQKGDSGRCDDTGALYRSSPVGEARGQSCGDPIAGLSSVHAEQNAGRRRLGGKCVCEGQPNRIDGGCVERWLAGDGADAVGPKELLHELLISDMFASSICVTSASSVPWERRA